MMSCEIRNRFWEKLFFALHTRGAWRNQTKIAGKMDGSDSSKPRGIAGEKNVPSECHRFIVIHGGVQRRKRNLIRSDATSVRHLKLQPDLQPEST